MSNKSLKSFLRRKRRVRTSLKSKANGKHRLVVNRTNNHLYAQVIDDSIGGTVVCVSTLDKSFKLDKTSNINAATELGKLVALKAKDKNIDTVYFDRGGYLYHGKVKAIAEAARENGLNF